jgi:hypothetical protein
MSETIYRFQVHYLVDKSRYRFVKFIADIRPHLHDNLDRRIKALIAMRSEGQARFQYSQREVFVELWKAWEQQNKKLASKLPTTFPERWLALKKIREKEFGLYPNPRCMLELWDAWSRQFPGDARKIDRRIKNMANKPQALRNYQYRPAN